MPDEARQRELAHHEELYSGFAQEHFAKPAVRAFRRHLVRRLLRRTGLSRNARVLSLGCGLGDTELLLAPSVGRIVGVDFSPAAIRQARQDAARAGLANAEFLEGDLETLPLADASFDGVLAIFFLHHLSDEQLRQAAERIRRWLVPGGVFYSLDPSRRRLSGAVGRLLVPHLMKKYQTPGERELVPEAVRELLTAHGFAVETRMYDFLSTPLAGLLPGARRLYRAARLADEVLVRAPLVARWGSNFELLARRRRG
jgi:ubiquinone/menaquinone biosynthesis C-methylase UbiE